MTLIVGLNLSDRLYIAGDTRVTFGDGSFSDDIIKVSEVCGESFHIIGQKNPNTICLAVAGNLSLAKYFFSEITSAVESGELPDDIRILSDQIKDFFQNRMDEWLKSNPYESCCIIFGGMTLDRKKEISEENLEKLKDILKKNAPSKEKLDDLKQKLDDSPVFQKIAKKIPKKNLERLYNKPDAMVINPLVQDAIDSNSRFIEAPDSLIFGVQVSRSGVKIETAEWGESLAYGTGGLTKDNLAEDFLATMELSPGQLVNEKDMMETIRVQHHILDIAKDKGIKQIGGVVTPMVMRDCLSYDRGFAVRTLEGEVLESVFLKKDGFYSYNKTKGEQKLTRFYSYKEAGGDAMLAL